MITFNTDQINITSQLIDNYIATPNATITIQYSINCCTLSEPTDASTFIQGNSLVLTPAFFNQTILLDGIYLFTIRVTNPNGSFTEEVSCEFINNTTLCDINQYLLTNPSCTLAPITYEALIHHSDCDSCGCPTMCELYKQLYKEIQIKSKTLTHECGCQ